MEDEPVDLGICNIIHKNTQYASGPHDWRVIPGSAYQESLFGQIPWTYLFYCTRCLKKVRR